MELLQLIDSQEKAVAFLMQTNILRSKLLCLPCNTEMCLEKTSDNKDRLRWKCYGCKCGKTTKGILYDSFYSQSKLDLSTLTLVIY
jgi:transposase-like protein